MNWDDIRKLKLEMYSTAWCGDCHRLKAVFAVNKVDFEEVDIDANPEAAKELMAATGKSAIPFVKVNGDFFIRGWHSEVAGQWSDELFFKEVEEQLNQGE